MDGIALFTLACATVIAVVTPALLILIRNNVRRKRTGVILELERSFGWETHKIPSFELVKSKYTDQTNDLSSWKLFISSLPFIFVLFVALTIMFTPNAELTDEAINQSTSFFRPILMMAGDADATSHDGFRSTLTVLSFVFAGSIIFALNYLLTAITNFELGPLSFLRVTMHILSAAAVATALWQVARNDSLLGPVWLVLALLIGFFPDLGLRYAMTRLPVPMKSYRDDLLPSVSGIPLEVIDGIDAHARFRLQEAMLFDVQNLATTNPIMLHVETPYGFYQCIDWVAQAQLCTVVGPDAFVKLRHRNIRTIFDLKRAAKSGPAIRHQIAAIMLPSKVMIRGLRSTDLAEDAGFQLSDDDLIAFFKVVLDDLHVHRLRQIWNSINSHLVDEEDRRPSESRSGEEQRQRRTEPDLPNPDAPPALAVVPLATT